MTVIDIGFMPTWRDKGCCYNRPHLMEDTRRAASLCYGCPVLTECREWVLAIPLHLGPEGVVAAMTESERELIITAHEPPKQCAECHLLKPVHHFKLSAPGQPHRRSKCRPCTSNTTGKGIQ